MIYTDMDVHKLFISTDCQKLNQEKTPKKPCTAKNRGASQ